LCVRVVFNARRMNNIKFPKDDSNFKGEFWGIWNAFIILFTCACTVFSTHSFICLTTGPYTPQKRVLRRVRPSALSCNFHYLLIFLRSPSRWSRLLPRLLVTSILPSIFPSVTYLLRKMWPIQLVSFAWQYDIPFVNDSAILLHFSHDQPNWSSPPFSNTTFQNLQGVSDLLFEVSKFKHHTRLCSKCNNLLVSYLTLIPVCLWKKKTFLLTILDFASGVPGCW